MRLEIVPLPDGSVSQEKLAEELQYLVKRESWIANKDAITPGLTVEPMVSFSNNSEFVKVFRLGDMYSVEARPRLDIPGDGLFKIATFPMKTNGFLYKIEPCYAVSGTSMGKRYWADLRSSGYGGMSAPDIPGSTETVDLYMQIADSGGAQSGFTIGANITAIGSVEYSTTTKAKYDSNHAISDYSATGHSL